MKLRLTAKLLIPLVALVISGLVVSIGAAYLSAKKELEKLNRAQIIQLSDSIAAKVDNWMERNKVDIDNWSRMDVVVNSLGSMDAKTYRMASSTKMKNYVDRYGIFNGMRVTNAQGIVIASSTAKNIGTVNVASRKYFKRSMAGEIYVSDPLISKTSGKPILVISAPVKAANQIKGILYAVVDLGAFTEKHFDTVNVGKTGYVFMINKAGITLAYPPDKKEIMKLDLSKFDFGKKILEMKNGVLEYNFKGDKKLVAVKEVPSTGWITAGTAPFQEIFETAVKTRNLLLIIGAIITVIMSAGIVLLVSFFVIKPLNHVVDGLKDIAQGEKDLTKRLDINREDEIGDLARWFDMFIGNLQKMILQISGNSETIHESSNVVKTLNYQVSDTLKSISERFVTVSDSCTRASGNMNSVSAAMNQASGRVDAVAAAAEEMSSSVDEIAKNTASARRTTDQTVELANRISNEVQELGSAANEIDQVTATITDISSQTNLLALNATIEAARAGEAGKGFAVVASEIKELANQTAQATLEIRTKIESVQAATDTTIGRVNEVVQVIGDSSEVVNSIASAVEEQSAATKEIAANAGQTAAGIQEVNKNITDSSERIHQINTEIERERKSIEDVAFSTVEADINSNEMSKISLSLEALADKFHTGEAKFSIGRIKVAHLAWRTTLEAVIRGVKEMDPEAVTSHTECELGKWYTGEGQALSSVPGFQELDIWHEKVHQIARDVVRLCSKGQTDKAASLMDDFKEARENLFKLLDSIYMS